MVGAEVRELLRPAEAATGRHTQHPARCYQDLRSAMAYGPWVHHMCGSRERAAAMPIIDLSKRHTSAHV